MPAAHPAPHVAPTESAPTLQQRPAPSSAAFVALALAARLHGVSADPDALRHASGLGPAEPVPRSALVLAARGLGLRARLVRSTARRLAATPLPALAMLRDDDGEGGDRPVVLLQCDGARLLYLDPGAGAGADAGGGPTLEPLALFTTRWTGELLLLAPATHRHGDSVRRGGLRRFAPAAWKHRGLLAEVLLMSLALQLLALLSPLFFQVVMDKVLVHQALATLDVMVAGWVAVMTFEAALGLLRSHLLGHTGHRIDVELASRLFRHLMALPLAYFQARRVGDTVARVRELDPIRQFLTGPALTVALDLAFALLFVAILLAYSVPLTLLVLASLPVYAGLSLATMPLLRARLERQFAHGADAQALLVETLASIETVKAGALEPVFARRWDERLAAHARASFATRRLAAGAQEAFALIGKLTQALLLWWGAREVMDGALTVGEFVAFNLFAQRVSQPVMRLAQFGTELQQVRMSARRLGDILDTPAEPRAPGGASWPAVRGRVTLEGVRFRYPGQDRPALEGISLDLRPGEVVGIVGRSGCGKSTLARLIQRLHAPEQGRVLIDGLDIALADPGVLRRQVGVVLQDNRLFLRSVRDNIAIADPSAPLAAVVEAARLSGADDFIRHLPQGYDTPVGELGTALSGGQRQRIAIARALIADPRILILDEATSALDYESEAVIQRNMRGIAAGRTVIVIAHRLSSVCQADRIVVMDHGRIVQAGRHAQLLAQPDGLYARLWRLQSLRADVDAGATP